MSDTLTTPATPATPAAPVTPAPVDVLKQATSWDDVKFETPTPPTDGMSVTDGADEPETPVAAAEDPTDGAEFVQDETGRWHRGDGTMASAEEIAQIEAQIASEAAPPEAPAEEAQPTENVVTLKRRDGSTREVVIDDPELADEIRANANDGMRGREYREKVAALDARLAQFNKMDALLQKNPEAVVRESLSREQKINLGVMLLAEHFDDLIPAINEYNTNPSARIAATAEAQLRMKTQTDEFNSFTAAQNAAAEVRAAVAKLIPENVAEDVAQAFWTDASRDCQEAMARGENVGPSTVAGLLANRLKLYGFAPSASPAASRPRIALKPSAPSAAASAVAQPANDAAKALADAKATQKRIQLRQQQRNNAAAVPPVGAGAAPVRMPAIQPGSDIKSAGQQLRKLSSWAASST